MKRILPTLAILLFCFSAGSFSQSKSQTFFEIKVYHYDNSEQDKIIDSYLKEAFIPALHRKGIKHIGVFKPVGNDTLKNKRIYVLIPYKNANQYAALPDLLLIDARLKADGKVYLEAPHSNIPYKRMESIFLKGFQDMPYLKLPSLDNDLGKRVYELRSYEGPTEQLNSRKVDMFNKGGEIKLFDKLDFNAVFYGTVISGSRMPNLMYMTTFEDMPSRDAHWKAFFGSPEWKELTAITYYKNTVSRSEVILLTPAEYSDF